MALFVQKADERLDRDRFVKDGYIVVRGLFTPPELAALQSCVEELPSLDGPIQTVERVKGEPAPNRTEAFADYHEELNEFLRSGPLPRFVEQLVGEPVLLFKEKVNYKAPGGSGGYTPHQDAYSSVEGGLKNLHAPADTADVAWDEQFYVCMVGTPLATQIAVTPLRLLTFLRLVTAVDASDSTNGCPTVAPGYHTRGLFRHTFPPYQFETNGAAGDGAYANIGEEEWMPVIMEAGDVLSTPATSGSNPGHRLPPVLVPSTRLPTVWRAVYNQYMPHTSAPNASARWRRALFGVYNAASRGELRTPYYEAGRAKGARWGYTQAGPPPSDRDLR